jgi:hypothetical protein
MMTATRTAFAQEAQNLYGKLAGDCWACDILSQAGAVGLDVAQQTFDAIARQLAAVLGMLMAIWLALLAGRFFLPFGTDQSPPQLWNRAVRQVVAFAGVLAFLQSSDFFWDYLFMPIFSSGIGLSMRLLSQASQMTCSVNVVGTGVAGAKAALESVRCPLSSVQDVFTKGMLTGVAMTMGSGEQSWLNFIKIWNWPGQYLQMFSGVLLALIYAFGFLMFPLFFLDTVLRGAIIAIFSPLATVLAPFSGTRPLTVKAVWGLALSAITMIFTSVAAGLAMQCIAQSFATLNTSDGSSLSDWSTLIGALESGSLKLSIVDQSFWMLLSTGFIAIYMVRGAARMAAALTGSPASAFSGATDGLASMVAAGTRLTMGALRRGVLGR